VRRDHFALKRKKEKKKKKKKKKKNEKIFFFLSVASHLANTPLGGSILAGTAAAA
jgi:hypothetical protein